MKVNTFENAVKLLEVEYRAALQNEQIKKPLAYALYHVWKRADRECVRRKDGADNDL